MRNNRQIKITNTTAGSRGTKYTSVENNNLRTCERIQGQRFLKIQHLEMNNNLLTL